MEGAPPPLLVGEEEGTDQDAIGAPSDEDIMMLSLLGGDEYGYVSRRHHRDDYDCDHEEEGGCCYFHSHGCLCVRVAAFIIFL